MPKVKAGAALLGFCLTALGLYAAATESGRPFCLVFLLCGAMALLAGLCDSKPRKKKVAKKVDRSAFVW